MQCFIYIPPSKNWKPAFKPFLFSKKKFIINVLQGHEYEYDSGKRENQSSFTLINWRKHVYYGNMFEKYW